MRARLTWEQREARKAARRAGQQVLTALSHMQAALHEAEVWGPVDLDQADYWQGRVNRFATTATVYARVAARWALEATK